ncbi:MAG: hypothetical protein ACKVQQ_11820 [Burkholderiales bacterium]
MKTIHLPNKVQGEGDYKATRRHRASTEAFVASGKVDAAAKAAAPHGADEEAALLAAEQAGEAHSKGEDPASSHAPVRKPPGSAGPAPRKAAAAKGAMPSLAGARRP